MANKKKGIGKMLNGSIFETKKNRGTLFNNKVKLPK